MHIEIEETSMVKKRLPYGISDFVRLRRDDMYYVDKTMYLPLLEEENSYLSLLRPRRFGKSLLLSMMAAYYDVDMKDRFNDLFGDLWIGQHPTPLANSYLVLRFDFSKVGGDSEDLEARFNDYCNRELDSYVRKYKNFYEEDVVQDVLLSKSAEDKLNTITINSSRLELRLYLIIDEYDNFTNDVLAKRGKEAFQELTHAEGFYRRIFKLFKGPIERIFLTGISPVTLDDLTSGYNIDWDISHLEEFNSLLGFEGREVRQIIEHFKEHGAIEGEADSIIADMKPWYDNYCFSHCTHGRETVYNSDMVLYYMRSMLRNGQPPADMVDKNIKTDISKLKALVNLDRGIQRCERESVIERIATQGWIDMRLKTSFPAKDLLKPDNFQSLIYYYGMLSIGAPDRGLTRMVIPNECVRQQYWSFLVAMFQDIHPFTINPLLEAYGPMICQGDWKKALTIIGRMYKELSALRDLIGGEYKVQGFCKALLGVCDYALLCPELELNYGYSDFVMIPLRSHFPEAIHAYVLEIKYVGTKASDAEVKSAYTDAKKQIEAYCSDSRLLKAVAGCTLHGIALIFQGHELLDPQLIVEMKI
ncbi:MAG: ATP-binding protein [Bacteroidales bacterium]|nr:ATP-binding protein [Bacteroidales bacterium]